MLIVKLGGSLSRDPGLRDWLKLLAGHGGRVAIVPGGGEFAETGRAMQAHWGTNDLTAHNMAVLGMAQFAQLMHGLQPGLPLAESEAAIRVALARQRAPIWLPTDLQRDRPDELTNWNVTSDSLAAWLALRLRAARVVLIKSCPLPEHATPRALAEAGIVDAVYEDFARRCEADGIRTSVLSRSDLDAMRRLLQAGH
jgi:aspartokinase-like uncharacterized kinase